MKIKKLLSNLIPNKYKYGKSYVETFQFLKENENWTEEEIKNYQLNKINQLLNYCIEKIPFYKELHRKNQIKLPIKNFKELEKIPILTKKIIRENFEKLQSGDLKKLKAKIVNTGGSTGEPLKLYKSKENHIKEAAFIDYYLEKMGVNINKKRKITIRGAIPKEGIAEKCGNELIMSSYLINKNNIRFYIEEIEKFNPEFIHVYPSSIYLISKYINELKLQINVPNLKVILSSSEIFNKKQKTLVEEVFKCKILDLYGNTENSVQAISVTGDIGYKFNPYYSYVEIINNEIVATAFNDLSMPLIRYATGDEIEKVDNNNFIIKGRKQDYIVGKNDKKYPVVGIIFGQHFSCFENIDNFQIYQNEKGKIELKIEKNSEISQEKEKEIIDNLKRATQNSLEVKINYVEKIERTRVGKYKFLIQNIK